MSDDFEQRARELEEKAERMLATAKARKEAVDKARSAGKNTFSDTLETAREFNQNVSWLRKVSAKLVRYYQAVAGVIQYIWLRSGPVRKLFGPTLRFIGRHYARFFRWVAYKENEKTGERVLSKSRTALAVLLTIVMLVAIWFGTRPVLITLQQGVMALISQREAYTYFHGSETIEEGSLYTIKTTSRVPATPESTTHMQAQQDVFYWIWYPEDLANAVPNEVAWGRVKYTGWRVKILNWYPEVKDVEAIPLSELPDDHPAKSGTYYISDEELAQAKRDGISLPGTDLNKALSR